MQHTNRNFIIAYIALVGLPILGLVGILRSGRGIAAPVSVDGSWTLQADAARLAALPCGKSLAGADVAMQISQSGGSFTVSLGSGPKSVSSGVLVGNTLKASVVPSAADESDCSRGRELALLATIDPKANPRSLTGTISSTDCPECAPVEFHAVRRPSAMKGAH